MPKFDGSLIVTGDESTMPRVATYFTRYPDPLNLSVGPHILFAPGKLAGYDVLPTIGLHYDADDNSVATLPAEMATHPFVSIRFHSGERLQSTITENINDVLRVVSMLAPALGFEPIDEVPPNERDEFSLYTVVEMVTPLIMPQGNLWVPAPLSANLMGQNFTRCIDMLNEVVSAYRLVENVRIPVPARERLGPTVVGATRPANPSGGSWDPEEHRPIVANAYALARSQGMPPVPSPEVGQKIGVFLAHKMDHNPTVAIMELQADARVALEQAGDFRSAIVLIHTASEVLLDAALACMYWEEGQTIEATATVFRNPLLSRVRNQYHERLGGSWSLSGDGVVASWRQSLVLLRHRVVHEGFAPWREAADTAFSAHDALRDHLMARLHASITKYPLSAGILLGESGLRRRGPWTRRKAMSVAAGGERLPDFTAWRRDLIAARTNPSSDG